jgi:hypothetical protein
MASTHFSGPVVSSGGFVDASGNTMSAADLIIGATSLSEAEVAVLDGVTPGTATASKAVVLGASKEIATITTATITNLTTSALTLGATALGATAAELNARCDDSAMVDTRADAGAISVTTAYTAVTTTGAAAITLAAPSKPAFVKVIKMTTDGGDATLASTNIVGQSSGTTSITFNDVDDTLVLISDVSSGKWIVLKEYGVTAA